MPKSDSFISNTITIIITIITCIINIVLFVKHEMRRKANKCDNQNQRQTKSSEVQLPCASDTLQGGE